jgi:CDP-diacylglycerol--glycerol-3-phosphate 3-phosphatidyltransferase
MTNLRDFFGVRVRKGVEPLVRALDRMNVTPNQLTVFGALMVVGSAVLVGLGYFVAAGVVFLVGSAVDMLDGSLARMAQKVTPFGAFFDSTLDRASEGAVLAAIAYQFAEQGRTVDVAFVVVALTGSILVSYTRARAEALGLECKVGLMSRPERVLLITVGLLFSVLLPYVIYVLAALTTFTVIQRLVHSHRQLVDQDSA